jgi:hypothetical protein
MQGQGTYTYPSGDVYKGGFEAGLKQGSGTYVFKVRTPCACGVTDHEPATKTCYAALCI